MFVIENEKGEVFAGYVFAGYGGRMSQRVWSTWEDVTRVVLYASRELAWAEAVELDGVLTVREL